MILTYKIKHGRDFTVELNKARSELIVYSSEIRYTQAVKKMKSRIGVGLYVRFTKLPKGKTLMCPLEARSRYCADYKKVGVILGEDVGANETHILLLSACP